MSSNFLFSIAKSSLARVWVGRKLIILCRMHILKWEQEYNRKLTKLNTLMLDAYTYLILRSCILFSPPFCRDANQWIGWTFWEVRHRLVHALHITRVLVHRIIRVPVHHPFRVRLRRITEPTATAMPMPIP